MGSLNFVQSMTENTENLWGVDGPGENTLNPDRLESPKDGTREKL